MGNIEITTKLSKLKSVSSIDDDYSEAATGGVLKNFVIFTEKHLCWSFFFIKLQASKFIEKRLQNWCFPLHVRKFLRTPILKNSERLLLIILFSNLFVFDVSLQLYRKTNLSVKKVFIEIRLCNRMMYVFKGHVKIVKIYMVKFNVSILIRLKTMFFS